MVKILLVEDDTALGTALEFSLKDEGYDVAWADSIQEAELLWKKEKCDIILLDVNLPDGSGYDFCNEIRKISDVPIIFLTALDEEVNIVMGLELGANDYLTKPFGVRELVARIKVQLRPKQAVKEEHILVSGDITADLSRMNVLKGDLSLTLTSLEIKLLLLFMKNPFRLLKREEILEYISGSEGGFFDENTLSVYVKRLREKIEDDAKSPGYIITKRGAGYQWNVEVNEK